MGHREHDDAHLSQWLDDLVGDAAVDAQREAIEREINGLFEKHWSTGEAVKLPSVAGARFTAQIVYTTTVEDAILDADYEQTSAYATAMRAAIQHGADVEFCIGTAREAVRRHYLDQHLDALAELAAKEDAAEAQVDRAVWGAL